MRQFQQRTAENGSSSSRVLASDAATILAETCFERTSSLFAWCIMSDHIHLLIRPRLNKR
ncbi:MAG: transposase [Deltaproteobacteria bacterium]|nr:transposase [Deltaproteobacteria bacterium]